MNIDNFIEKLENVVTSGSGWSARCPVAGHDDSRNSLSISEGEDKCILIKCHAGCDTRDVVSAMGLTMSDLFPPKEKKAKTQSGKIVATYDYCDENNVLIYQVVRYEPKSFRQRRPGPNGSWVNDLKGVAPLLYRLPELKRRTSEPIFLVEGEKDANTLAGIGLLATSASGGAAKKWDVNFTPHFAGRDVVIIPDNDVPGEDYALRVAQALHGVASSVKILTIPNLPPKGDVSDYLGKHGDREGLLELVRNESVWSPSAAKGPELEVYLDCTDLGNARRFVHEHKDATRYCPQRSQWLHWNGRQWIADQDGEIMRKAQKTASAIFAEFNGGDLRSKDETSKWARQTASLSRMKAMVSIAETQSELLVRSEELDQHLWLLNVRNGTVDLKSGTLLPHNPNNYLTVMAPVDYNPTATSKVWDDFLERALPSIELRSFLHRVSGYTLSGSTAEEIFLFLYGPPASGKSTFLEALSGVMGPYACSTSFKTFTTEGAGGNSASSDIARLAGKRLVRSSEIDKSDAFSEAVIKKLTGGESLACRFLYKEYFEFRPEFTIFIASNDRAKARDNDPALWRRLIEVPFAISVSEKNRDPRVKRTLLDLNETGEAILNWAIQGAIEYQRIGLAIPDEVRAATEEYRTEMDPTADFFEDCIVLNPLARVDNGALWAAYEQWCHVNGVKYGISQKNLKKRLEQKGFTQHRDAKHRYWAGLRLRRDGEVDVEKKSPASVQVAHMPLYQSHVPKMTREQFAKEYL